MKSAKTDRSAACKSRFRPTRRALIFWCLFIGLGAVWGAICMFVDPGGRLLRMDAMLPYFRVLPFADVLFRDYLFSGVALLIVNGLTNLLAAVLLLRNRRSGVLLGMSFGVTLMLWICIQFYMFPPNVLSTAYFVFGLIQFLTGYAAWFFYRQEHFAFSPNDYPNIGTDPTRLVVYFSRMGYTRKLAYEAANACGAQLYEVVATERTAGTLGFWWCGRYGMHGWAMPIEEIAVDLRSYAHVTICSPIWVFGLSAPMRQFCKLARGAIREADYILCHHRSGAYENAAREMDSLLGITHTALKSVRCRKGRYRA